MRPFLTAVLFALLAITPAHAGSMDEKALELKNVVVGSVYASKTMDTSSIEGLTAVINIIAQKDKLALEPIIEGLRTSFFATYPAALPFPIMAEAEVLATPGFSTIATSEAATVASGYPYIGVLLSGPAIKKGFGLVPAADGMIVLQAVYAMQSTVKDVAGTARANITCSYWLKLFDRDAKALYGKMVTGESTGELNMSKGFVVDFTNILALAQEATLAADAKLLAAIATDVGKARK